MVSRRQALPYDRGIDRTCSVDVCLGRIQGLVGNGRQLGIGPAVAWRRRYASTQAQRDSVARPIGDEHDLVPSQFDLASVAVIPGRTSKNSSLP